MEINFTEYQQQIVTSVTESEVEDAPAPWKKQVSDWVETSVGAVGFTKDYKYLVCTDGGTRWCYDLDSGKIEYCNDNDSDYHWSEEIWDSETLCILGVGQFENNRIRSSGIFGCAAGLLLQTKDGWCLTNFIFPYYEHNFLLQKPNETVFCSDPKFTNVHTSATTHIAHGFTPDGLKLVIVDRDQILVYSRSGA